MTPAPVSTETVTIDSRDARLVVNLGLVPQYRVWLATQYIIKQFHYPGWFPLDELNKLRLANITGLNWHTIRVLLSTGAETWWKFESDGRGGQVLKIVGQVKVSAMLGALAIEKKVIDPRERGIRYLVPVANLQASKQEFVITLFDTWISTRSGARGYQARYKDLAELWGSSVGQVRRWVAHSTATHKERCRGFLEVTGVSPAEVETIDPVACGIDHGFAGTQDGVAGVVYDRANRYHGTHRRARPGKAGKAQRAVNRAGVRCRSSFDSNSEAAPAPLVRVELNDLNEGQASDLTQPVVASRTNYWLSMTKGWKAYFEARSRRPQATLYRQTKQRYRARYSSSFAWVSRPVNA